MSTTDTLLTDRMQFEIGEFLPLTFHTQDDARGFVARYCDGPEGDYHYRPTNGGQLRVQRIRKSAADINEGALEPVGVPGRFVVLPPRDVRHGYRVANGCYILNWTPAAGDVDHYEVERQVIGDEWQLVAKTTMCETAIDTSPPFRICSVVTGDDGKRRRSAWIHSIELSFEKDVPESQNVGCLREYHVSVNWKGGSSRLDVMADSYVEARRKALEVVSQDFDVNVWVTLDN